MLNRLQFGSGKTFRNISATGKALNWVLVAAEAAMMVRKPSIPRGMILVAQALTAIAYHLPEPPGESE